MARKAKIPEELKTKRSELFDIDGTMSRVNYAPKAALNRLLEWIDKIESGDANGYDLNVCKDIHEGKIEKKTAIPAFIDDVAGAYSDFVNVCVLYNSREMMESVLQDAPRKKDGTLTLRRVRHLAYIPYGVNQEFYELCAVNETVNVMSLEIRKSECRSRSIDALKDVPSCEEIIALSGADLPLKKRPSVGNSKKVIAKASPDFVIDRNILKKYTGKDEVVEIPDGVIKIAEDAFVIDGTIKHIIIPDSVKEIAKEFVTPSDSFYNSYDRPVIQRIDFPRYIKSIPKPGWIILREMTIPDELPAKELHLSDAFRAIEKLYVRDTSPCYKIVDDFLLSRDGKVLYFYPRTKDGECRVPFGVETIAEYAFYLHTFSDRSQLRKIFLPPTLKYIEYEGLNLAGLEEVEIPSSVIDIHRYAIWRSTVIKGKKGSAAEKYAEENEMRFQEI